MNVDATAFSATMIGQRSQNAPPLAADTQIAPDQIAPAAEEFEAFFLSQMFGYMFAGIETNSLFGGGQSGTMFRSLLVDEYGKAVARAGGIGLANDVAREILKAQESG